jgi:uncharacterized membrane protein
MGGCGWVVIDKVGTLGGRWGVVVVVVVGILTLWVFDNLYWYRDGVE